MIKKISVPAGYGINSQQPFQNGKILKFKSGQDSFEHSTKTEEIKDKSNNGKFDLSEAAKNFVKGVISPLTAIKEHPLLTIGLVAGTAALCTFVPVLTPIMTIGFGALSVFQLGKGCYNTVKNYKEGKYDDAERSMKEVGQGTVGTVLSFLGLKNSAKIAKEAKLMSELGTNTLTQVQRETIATEIGNGSRLNALKEILSLFTTKSGLKATFTQFKPSMIHTRYIEFKEALKGKRPGKKKLEQEIKKQVDPAEEFKKTPEGIRRANLTDEQIEQEVRALYKKAFDELGIPEENRPTLNIKKASANQGGAYNKDMHCIEFNPESYKSGYFELDDVIMHEATHCKEALLRAGLPQDRVDEIVKNALIDRIRNGESEKIIVKGNILGPDMMEPPKMSAGMKEDFIQFVSKEMYKEKNPFLDALFEYDNQFGMMKSNSSYFDSSKFAQAQQDAAPILDKLKLMLKNHPEFVEQYGSEEEALNILAKYSISHNIRFSTFRNTGIEIGQKWGSYPKKINVTLTAEQIKDAEISLVNEIESVEGNAGISGFHIFGPTNAEFNQYQFSAEEVLAQQNGNNFLIKNMTAQLEQMRKAGTLTPEHEQYMLSVIDKAKMVIDYKTKGLEYYKLYTQLLHEPNNQQLAETVKLLEKEIEILGKQITPEKLEIIKQVIEVPDYLNPDILTRGLPFNITAVPDILPDLTQSDEK